MSDLRLIGLKANNFMRLKAVELDTDGQVITISGRNGAGKTSILNAIWVALGGSKIVPKKPIREGQESAEIELNLGDFVVRRTFTDKGTYLKVSTKEGHLIQSPQAVLNKLIAPIAFSPMDFTRMDAKKQFEALREIVPLEVDLDALAVERKSVFDERTDVNRNIKSFKASIDRMEKLPEDCPTEEQSVSELSNKLSDAVRANQENEEQKHSLQRMRDRYNALVDEIKELQETLKAKQQEAEVLFEQGKQASKEVEALKYIDVQSINDQILNAEEHNRLAREFKKQEETRKQLEKVESLSEKLTDQIGAIDSRKQKALEEAEFPVEGLGFGDGIVTYNGVPLDQASGAEKWRVAIAIGMAANPKLRILLITDGSLMDSESLKMVSEMAIENDFQVFIEMVDESGEVGFVIEDGQVIRSNAA